MKKMKKMMAVLVVLAMLLSMACTSAYADSTITITISDAQPGHTYTIYKLMDLNEDAGTYVYTVNNSAWKAFFTTGEGKKYVALDASNQVTWKYATNDAAAAKALAADAVAAAEATGSGITNDGSAAADAGGNLTFTGTHGYYVVKSTAGTFLTLNSVYGSNLSLSEKNNLPNVDKAVKNHDITGSAYGAAANAEIGDIVDYKITVAAKAGAKDYTVEDVLPAGVTLDTTSVKVYTDEACTTELAAENYTYTTDTSAEDKLTVVFKNTYLADLTDGQKTYITYSGTVNSDVVTGNATNSNPNTATLKVSGVVAKSAVANINTFKIQVNKVDKADATKLLAGAQFKLYSDSNTGYMKVVDGKITWVEENSADVFETDTNGTFEIKGLVPGDYELKEIKAPAGYNLLASPETVTFNKPDGNAEITVENSKGQILPDTGGMGTTLFYAFGAVMMAGATVLFVSRKRRTN